MTFDPDADVIIRMPSGLSFRCDACGCNVFRRYTADGNRFRCNGCGACYIGEGGAR